jgi:hypothetical protein
LSIGSLPTQSALAPPTSSSGPMSKNLAWIGDMTMAASLATAPVAAPAPAEDAPPVPVRPQKTQTPRVGRWAGRGRAWASPPRIAHTIPLILTPVDPDLVLSPLAHNAPVYFRPGSEQASQPLSPLTSNPVPVTLALYLLRRRCHRWRLSLFLCLCFDILFLRHFLTLPMAISSPLQLHRASADQRPGLA